MQETVKTAPERKEKTKTRKKPKIESPSNWRVVMFNDDVTPFAFVVALVIQLFGYGVKEAELKTREAQDNGKAVLGVYPKAIAETKAEISMRVVKTTGYPLTLKAEEDK